MSDSDDSAVLVEHDAATASSPVSSSDEPPSLIQEEEEAEGETTTMKKQQPTLPAKASSPPQQQQTAAPPQAYNIVSIGSAQDAYAFTFHEDKLQEILQRVPPKSKVAVVSVVGAFRTGKSFLLSWFLRYLHAHQPNNNITDKDAKPWYEQFDSLGNDGFHWKAGSDRDTTGIWMWSHPQLLPRSGNGEPPLAVLLVDTQGMFDHETTMNLTASIFGFSTLLSSYQVFNVDKRIQEDDLQQLALFSEFAKIAIESDQEDQDQDKKEDDEDQDDDDKPAEASLKSPKEPFQRIEFLVRDWEHFDDDQEDDDDEEDEDAPPNFERMQHLMDKYFEKTIAPRDAKDLAETREQIHSCFENISCYGLCHPGFSVTKKKFTGSVQQIEPLFLQLLDRFCHRVFSDPETMLQPKQIHGHELTAPQLGTYIAAYAQLFATGAKFPPAATLLEATAVANNTNAIQLAIEAYKEEMDRVAGPNVSDWWKADELRAENDRGLQRGLEVFESMANFGSRRAIQEARSALVAQMDSNFTVYKSLNDGRNPLAGLETYFIPAAIATMAVVLRWFTDMTCSPYSSICRNTSHALSHTSAMVWCFLLIVAATKFKQIKDLINKVWAAVQAVSAPPQKVKQD